MDAHTAAWVSGVTLGLVFILVLLLARTAAAVGRANRKLDALLRHSGVDMARVAATEVADLVRAGRKIDAIKTYREMTGAGLAEARAAVERLRDG